MFYADITVDITTRNSERKDKMLDIIVIWDMDIP
jgi:hypothetical protein